MAVAMRDLSVYRDLRVRASEVYQQMPVKINVTKELLADLENSLAFSFVIAYAQGLSMLAKASDELKMDIPLPAVIKVWKAGCIIRSALLGNFTDAYSRDPKLSNLLLDSEICDLLKNRENSIRNILSLAIKSKIPVNALSSALGYYDAFLSKRMPTNLIQAQRDFFGAHTYQRIDKPGVFHTEWHTEPNN
jgi:6-phosphogluconate dehydrogenase